MREYITEILAINYVNFILAFATIIVGFVVIKEAVEKFAKAVGIELKWVREKEEMKECQTTVKSAVSDLVVRQSNLEKREEEERTIREEKDQAILDALTCLRNDISNLEKVIEKNEAEQRFKKLRFDLLNFANKISESERVSAELIQQVYREIHEYEHLVEVHGFKNNQVTASVAVITKKYQEMLLNGQIVEDQSIGLDLYQ